MKKFMIGALTGLAVYKIVQHRGIKSRIKARAKLFVNTVADKTMDNLLERAMKNGVTMSEMEDVIRIVTKAMR